MKNLKMIIAIFLVILTAFGWVSYGLSSSSDILEYKENLKKAEEYTQKGLYYRAIDSYEQVVKYKPTEENWKTLLSVCILNCNEYPEYFNDYIKYLDNAVNDYPKNVDFIYDLAMAYYDDESYSSAYKTVKTAIENGIKDEKIITLERNLKYVYRLKGSTFSEFYSPVDKIYSVHASSGWGAMESDGKVSDSWDNLYYGPLGENKEKVITKQNLGTRLYDKNGKVLAKFENEIISAGRFSQGYIPIEIEKNQFAYFNEFGEKTFGDFEKAGTFYNGLAAVCKNGKWGVINDKGEFEISPEFDEIVLDNYGYFNKQDFIVVCKNGKYGFYDESFKKISDFEADNIGVPTKDGLLAFCQAGKWGYADYKGKIQIDPQYENALSFSNGLAAICIDNKWGFIDTENNIVIECTFAGADYFTEEGSCCVRVDALDVKDSPIEWQLLVLELGL